MEFCEHDGQRKKELPGIGVKVSRLHVTFVPCDYGRNNIHNRSEHLVNSLSGVINTWKEKRSTSFSVALVGVTRPCEALQCPMSSGFARKVKILVQPCKAWHACAEHGNQGSVH